MCIRDSSTTRRGKTETGQRSGDELTDQIRQQDYSGA